MNKEKPQAENPQANGAPTPAPFDQQMMSPSVDEICPALIKAQQSFKTVGKSKTVNLGGSRGYKYAPLESLIEEALPKLNANGLSLSQIIWPDPKTGADKLWSILLHTSGQFIASQYPLNLKEGANAHAIGSAITYARKYTFAPQIGLAVQDEDDDGNATLTNNQPKQKPQTVARPRADRRYVGQE